MKNHVIIHAKDPYFIDNQDKYQEMLDSVKKMKNIMHDLDSSDSICKTNSADNNLNCSISSNEDIKQSLNCSKSTNYSNSNSNLSSNEEDKINFKKNRFFFLKNERNEEKNENNGGDDVLDTDNNNEKSEKILNMKDLYSSTVLQKKNKEIKNYIAKVEVVTIPPPKMLQPRPRLWFDDEED